MKVYGRIMLVLAVLAASAIHAQQINLPQTRNAALRYWMAFAEMQDRNVDDSTTKLMEDVLAGTAQWDEQRLGPIVTANEAAIHTLQRGTALPECNWGLEYDRGSSMSIGHLPRARTLARLNALYGARQMAQGNAEGAAITWLAGLHFAQHVAKDLSLIAVLSAKPAMMANLHLLSLAVESGRMNAETLQKVRAQITGFPKDGLDFLSAVKYEAWADEAALKYLTEGNFQERYKTGFSQAPPPAATAPTEADIAVYRQLMKDLVTAFQMPYEQTKARLQQVEATINSAHPAIQAIMPNYSRLNENRREVALALHNLERTLGMSR